MDIKKSADVEINYWSTTKLRLLFKGYSVWRWRGMEGLRLPES